MAHDGTGKAHQQGRRPSHRGQQHPGNTQHTSHCRHGLHLHRRRPVCWVGIVWAVPGDAGKRWQVAWPSCSGQRPPSMCRERAVAARKEGRPSAPRRRDAHEGQRHGDEAGEDAGLGARGRRRLLFRQARGLPRRRRPGREARAALPGLRRAAGLRRPGGAALPGLVLPGGAPDGRGGHAPRPRRRGLPGPVGRLDEALR
mmetsp:Transcript_85877/g.278151  ORF Transcript_85877/g.278151 Transcript_85877/m.278151 type:complete len:200 (-) Transcript_85877:607-1206(-)